jgi:hypothetical protein
LAGPSHIGLASTITWLPVDIDDVRRISGEACEIPTAPKTNALVSITEIFCMASSAKRKYSNTTSKKASKTVVGDFDLTMTFPGRICGILGLVANQTEIIQS